jgi:hypothetical protein
MQGGHDHEYITFETNGVLVVKSGTDFRWLSHIKASSSAATAMSTEAVTEPRLVQINSHLYLVRSNLETGTRK